MPERSWFALVLGLACSAALTMCPAHAQTAPTNVTANDTMAPSLVLDQSDNWHSIVVSPGATVEIRLPETMGTGYSWKIKDSDDITIASEKHDQLVNKPGGTGSYSVSLSVAPSSVGRIWLAKSSGFEKPVEEFGVLLLAGQPPADEASAARIFAEHQMNQQCDLNKKPHGTVNHVAIVDHFAIASWTCGDMHGKYGFQLIGTAAGSKSKVTVGDATAPVDLKLEDITWLGATDATAAKLIREDRESDR